MVCAEPSGATKPLAHAKGSRAINLNHRADVVDEVIAGYEALMQRLADSHAPEFLEIDVTMPQAKLLYLLGAAGDLHMSELVRRLGVSLSTISGLVDRVVDHGLATRREDPPIAARSSSASPRRAPTSSTASASSTRRQMRELLGRPRRRGAGQRA